MPATAAPVVSIPAPAPPKPKEPVIVKIEKMSSKPEDLVAVF